MSSHQVVVAVAAAFAAGILAPAVMRVAMRLYIQPPRWYVNRVFISRSYTCNRKKLQKSYDTDQDFGMCSGPSDQSRSEEGRPWRRSATACSKLCIVFFIISDVKVHVYHIL